MNNTELKDTAKQMIEVSENSQQVIDNLREKGHGDVVDEILADLHEDELIEKIRPHCDKIKEVIEETGEETGKSITVQISYSAEDNHTTEDVRVEKGEKVIKSPPFEPEPTDRSEYHFKVNGEAVGYHSLSGGCNWHFQGHAGFKYYSGMSATEAEEILTDPDKRDSITFEHKGDEIFISGPYEAN